MTTKYSIKPLVWTDTPKRSWAPIPGAVCSGDAWYETEEVDRGDNFRMIIVFDRNGHAHISDPAPLENMKAAAQRDYEARLLAQGVIEVCPQ